MARSDGWTRDQLLLALRLYMRLPFGKLHRLNPEIIDLAAKIGRSPNALAMKACNFANLDPVLKARGVRGLSNLSNADREIWAEFAANSEALAAEAEDAAARLEGRPADVADADLAPLTVPTGETELTRLVRTRRVQSFFRAAVMFSYESRLAITGLAVPELLVASHIIPWSESVERRADPCNGICLSALFDRAFDRALITIDADLRVVVSPRLKDAAAAADLSCSILEAEGRQATLPRRFPPATDALEWHRRRFVG